MSLYLSIEICILLIPLLFSFDKKLRFFLHWKHLILSMCLTGSVYLLWDIYFTRAGIWGFNPAYHGSLLLCGLPVEEWLFFIIVPYASIFIHRSFFYYFPSLALPAASAKYVTFFLIFFTGIVIAVFRDRAYTVFNSLMVIAALCLSLIDKSSVIRQFYVSFIIIFIPFLIVDGILTGSFFHKEIVWYNSADIIGLRVGTVPIEDAGYAFSLILINLLIDKVFMSVFSKRK